MEKKASDFIKGNLLNLIVILTSISYIFYGMIGLEKTQLTLWQNLAQCGIGLIVGFMIKQGVAENGFSKGYNSQIWVESYTKYRSACNLANDYLDHIDEFYIIQIEEQKKEYRKQMLMAYQMRYDWFFDDDGNYIDNEERFKKLNKKQKKCLKKCVRVKIYLLNLFSEYATDVENSTKKEKTDNMQRSIMAGKNSFAMIAAAIVGAYFLPVWNGISWGSIIMSSIQVCIWLFTGIAQLYKNYNYVVVEKTNKLSRKMELIIKFEKWAKKKYTEVEKNEI